jgi:Phospholipase_D-nuclease N-terminal
MLLAADAARSAGSVVGVVLAVVICVGLLALFVAALLSVLRSPRLTGTGRVVWIIAVFVFPLLGPLAWFLVGRRSSAEVYRA